MYDFEEAKDKVMMGVQRKSMVLTDQEKETTAYHEAGHAIVAIKTKGADPVHKVTIIPRGRALGVTMQLPMDEKHGYSKPYVDGRLAILMGGRAAEMLIFNKMTTGAGNDIEQATQIARKMVTEWGMSDLLGPMTFGKKNEEISKIIRNAQRVSETILNDNEDLLHSMAKSLLMHETIDAKDIDKLLTGKKIIRRKSNTSKSSNGKLSAKSRATVKKNSAPIKSNGKL